MKIDPFNYEAMLQGLHDGRRFAWVRYSDGDWNCVFGCNAGFKRYAWDGARKIDERADMPGTHSHDYDERLGEEMLAAIASEPDYHLGIMPAMLAPDKLPSSNKTIEFVETHPELRWCSSLILHKASMAGRLGEFFEALRGLDITVVSNAAMTGMRPWLGEFNHVVTPELNCWDERADLYPRIVEACRAPGVVLFSCALPAKVWIRKAWLAGGEATLIDVGAVFDPYIGRMSRKYMRAGMHKLADRLY
jgi:hypothetical protein